jgi:hypothetical protein
MSPYLPDMRVFVVETTRAAVMEKQLKRVKAMES